MQGISKVFDVAGYGVTDLDVFIITEQLNDKLVKLGGIFEFKEIDDVMFSGGGELDQRDPLLFVFRRNTSELGVKSDGLAFIVE